MSLEPSSIRIPRRPRKRKSLNEFYLNVDAFILDHGGPRGGVNNSKKPFSRISTEPWYRIGSILREPSGAREETQFGLFGHGRITDFGDSDPPVEAPATTMAPKAKPNTTRGILTGLLRKNLVQNPDSYAVYSWPGMPLPALPSHPTVPFTAMIACGCKI